MASESPIVNIDGSQLEGGGQILRVGMSLSCLLNIPICVSNIRANRPKPGLAAQHLAGVKLVASISNNSNLDGGKIGSTELLFRPGQRLASNQYTQDCGTAGSITLMIQISLPCISFISSSFLSRQDNHNHLENNITENNETMDKNNNNNNNNKNMVNSIIKLRLIGGSNVSTSPPIDHFIHVLFPLLHSHIGLNGQINILQRGYYPKGGGIVELFINPLPSIYCINMIQQGSLISLHGVIYGNVDDSIKRELKKCLRKSFQSTPLYAVDGTSVEEIIFIEDDDENNAQNTATTTTNTTTTNNNSSSSSSSSNNNNNNTSSSSSSSGSSSINNYTNSISNHQQNNHRHNNHNHNNNEKRKFDSTKSRSTAIPITGIGCQLFVKTSTGCILSSNGYIDSKTNQGEINSIAFDNLVLEVMSGLGHLTLSGACIDEYTADQLILYMALAHGHSSLLIEPEGNHSSLHIVTAIDIASRLTGAKFEFTDNSNHTYAGHPKCRIITCEGVGFQNDISQS